MNLGIQGQAVGAGAPLKENAFNHISPSKLLRYPSVQSWRKKEDKGLVSKT